MGIELNDSLKILYCHKCNRHKGIIDSPVLCYFANFNLGISGIKEAQDANVLSTRRDVLCVHSIFSELGFTVRKSKNSQLKSRAINKPRSKYSYIVRLNVF